MEGLTFHREEGRTSPSRILKIDWAGADLGSGQECLIAGCRSCPVATTSRHRRSEADPGAWAGKGSSPASKVLRTNGVRFLLGFPPRAMLESLMTPRTWEKRNGNERNLGRSAGQVPAGQVAGDLGPVAVWMEEHGWAAPSPVDVDSQRNDGLGSDWEEKVLWHRNLEESLYRELWAGDPGPRDRWHGDRWHGDWWRGDWERGECTERLPVDPGSGALARTLKADALERGVGMTEEAVTCIASSAQLLGYGACACKARQLMDAVLQLLSSRQAIAACVAGRSMGSENLCSLAPVDLPPDALAPEALVPGALAREALGPEKLEPGALVPGALKPEALGPEKLEPEALVPGALGLVTSGPVTLELVVRELTILGCGEVLFSPDEWAYLRLLNRFGDPVPLAWMAEQLHCSPEFLSRQVEPSLIDLGLVAITDQGRLAQVEFPICDSDLDVSDADVSDPDVSDAWSYGTSISEAGPSEACRCEACRYETCRYETCRYEACRGEACCCEACCREADLRETGLRETGPREDAVSRVLLSVRRGAGFCFDTCRGSAPNSGRTGWIVVEQNWGLVRPG